MRTYFFPGQHNLCNLAVSNCLKFEKVFIRIIFITIIRYFTGLPDSRAYDVKAFLEKDKFDGERERERESP